MHGILLVDKSKGPTSHDVVARLRKLLRTKAIGHAGTLDPMATGLLVIGIGEATKLLAALTDDDKAYEATIRFGELTDTLDAEGTVVETAAVPTLERSAIEAAIAGFLGPHRQAAPVYSAIKRDGESLHARARRGEEVEAPVRDVVLNEATLLDHDATSARVSIRCGKGFYVRSFARDLAAALGTIGHLTALRRTASGGHVVEGAVDFARLVGDEGAALARDGVRTMVDSLGTIPTYVVNENGLVDAACGRPVALEDAGATAIADADEATRAGRFALVTADRKLVALARFEEGRLRIDRGFVEGQSTAPRRPKAIPEDECSESQNS